MLDYEVKDGPPQGPPADHMITVSFVNGSLQLGGDINPTPGDPNECDYITHVKPNDTLTWQPDQTVSITNIIDTSTDNVFVQGDPKQIGNSKLWRGTVGNTSGEIESYTIAYKLTDGTEGTYDPKIQVDS